jgi:integrase
MRELRLSAWSVQAILVTKRIIVFKRQKTRIKNFAKGLFHSDESEGKIVVYRGYFLRLLSIAKPLRDQLLIELPVLEAFRTGEVSSFKVECVDFDRGDLQVLDSKKQRFFMVPLDPVVAEHLAEYIRLKGLKQGIAFGAETKAGRKRKPNSKTKGAGLSLTFIQWVWRKWCMACGIPVMSPRMGRAYFACKWHYVDRKSMFALMTILRHDDILATQKYLAKIIDYDAVKTEFYRGMKSPFQGSCSRSDKCPMAVEGCFCRSFQLVEVKKQVD